MTGTVVMKFGGTSVGTPEAVRRTAAHIDREVRRPFVVVSAVGGVTDLLLRAGDAARRGEDFAPLVETIARKHHDIIAGLGLGQHLLVDLERELHEILSGIALLRELSPRVSDMLVSFERMSVVLLAAALQKRGRKAQSYEAWKVGMRLVGQHGRAEPAPDVSARIAAATAELDPAIVPIVTGFIGHGPDGEIATLGRGGSDYSAAIFGAGIGADEIQIWTDVPGILRADPRIIDGPGIVPACRFDEAAELAYFGAKVLHPRTMEPAREAGIPVRVLGTFHVDPDGDATTDALGTLISDDAAPEPVRALAIQRKVRSLYVHSLGMLDAPGFLAKVFEILARERISVDVVATSEVSVSMTFDRCDGDLDAAVAAIGELAAVAVFEERSILCLVGSGMIDSPQTRARIFALLAEADLPVHVISQGASRINLTLVMNPEDAIAAMRVLHAGLFC